MKRTDLITEGWSDYELLDSGAGEKLERYGAIILARPETQALWKKRTPELWQEAHAQFLWRDGKGAWELKKTVPDSWQIACLDATALLRLTNFKHTGIFPEQLPNWQWIDVRVRKIQQPQVLNLFGYTGIASVVAARAGAFVTHVDASKQSLDWAHENARVSGVPETAIRYLFDDALAFAKREVRRESKYSGIILDPPAFGRGAKGEVWKIEEHLPELLEAVARLLKDEPGSFVLLNGYAAGYAAQSFAQLLASAFSNVSVEYGDLNTKESSSERVIPSGIYARFVR